MDRATSLVKALDLLTLLGGRSSGYSVQELAEAMNRPRSTLVRILNTLVDYGLVSKGGRKYRCSGNFHQWATLDRHRALRLRYQRVLRSVAEATGELVLLGLKHGAGVIHIDYIESDQTVRVAPAPLTVHNIRHNAIGKLCIAGRSDLVEEWLRTDPDFKEELETIRRTGTAWNREESVAGMVAVACHGFDPAATEPKIAVAWPVQRFSERKGELACKAIRQALEQWGPNQ